MWPTWTSAAAGSGSCTPQTALSCLRTRHSPLGLSRRRPEAVSGALHAGTTPLSDDGAAGRGCQRRAEERRPIPAAAHRPNPPLGVVGAGGRRICLPGLVTTPLSAVEPRGTSSYYCSPFSRPQMLLGALCGLRG